MPARPNSDPNPNPDDTYSEGEGEEDMHGPGSINWANHCNCEVCEPGEHGHGSINWAQHCDCEVCEVCKPDYPNPNPNPDFPLRNVYVTDSEGDGEGSEADEGYSSAREDDSMQLADFLRGLPPGALIPPQRITPAVALERWRSRAPRCT